MQELVPTFQMKEFLIISIEVMSLHHTIYIWELLKLVYMGVTETSPRVLWMDLLVVVRVAPKRYIRQYPV